MLLSDGDIEYELDFGELEIENLGSREEQIQPASVDIRLGENYSVYDLAPGQIIDPFHDDIEEYVLEKEIPSDGLVLQPGEAILADSMESVSLPSYMAGNLTGRSSIGRLHVKVHETAAFFDPGFSGTCVFEIENNLDNPVRLYPGMRIGQMILEMLQSPAERPYGEDRGSKYQDQDSAVASRIHEDFI